tara:strand:+ start:156 stop:1631 length:1476 start_codon:yes stop_codon:yes gene_type:complete
MTKETLQHPGEFILTGPNIIGSSGEQINIGNLVLELNVYQNMDTPYMSGNILMNDAKGLYEFLPIIGQERLIFKLSTPSASGSVNFEEYHAIIYNVEKRFKTNDRANAYLLNWTTLDNYRNFRTKVSKSYKGNISQIVVQILTEQLKSKKAMFVDPTKNPRKVVIPNLSPYAACSFLREESISLEHQSPHYVFFENPLGYHFRSLDSLLGAQGSLSISHKKTYKSQPPDDPHEVGEATGTILAFEVDDSTNTFINGRGGMFASTLFYHDMFNKTLQKFDYNYLDDCYKKRNQLNQDSGKFGPFISETVVDDENKITDFPDSKIFVHPTSGKELHNEGTATPYTNNNAQDWLQESLSREMEREYFTLKIQTYGDTNIMVGDIVDVVIPSNRGVLDKAGGKDNMDKILSGRYLVTQLHHQVTPPSQAHKMTFTCMKDSVSSALPKTVMKFSNEPSGVKDIGLTKDKRKLTPKPRAILPTNSSSQLNNTGRADI